MVKRILMVLLVLCLTINTVSPISAAVTNKTQANLLAYMDAMEKNKNFQGAVRVEKGGKVLFEKAYGMSGVEKKVKNTLKTTFSIGSVTKQFTALAVMQLQEKGLLNIKDKLSKYIPDYPRGKEITLYNLLTHTSGIADFPFVSDLEKINVNNVKTADLVKLFESRPLDFKPGTKYSYSNSGYIILGYIVEKTSKMSLEDYLKKYIFKPLKMNSTGVCYKNNKKQYAADGYVGYLEVLPYNDEQLLKVAFGAGYLYSTVGDLSIWANALTAGKLVNKKTLEQMFSPHEHMEDLMDYGYGWVVIGAKGEKEVFHDGNTGASSAMIDLDIKNNIKIIILSNNGDTEVYSLRSTLRGIALGQKFTLPARHKEINLSPEKLDRYVGTYDVGSGLNIIISRDKNQLYAQLTGQSKLRIYAESETRFFYKLVDAGLVFTKGTDDTIQSLTLEQEGQEFKAEKVK